MTDGVRRLSHEEAETLISARMDEHLDRADSRALLVHLQSCESCRAFAVQSEVLGRELSALPVLPPSALVDRQIRETIAQGRSRWSLASLMPATAGNSGLRVAVGALAMLTLVSVYLLVRMAGDQPENGPSIDAPNGGVAQQLPQTPTQVAAVLGAVDGPTETPRLVVPKTPEGGSTESAGQVQDVGDPTELSGQVQDVGDPTESSVAPAEDTSEAAVEPTATLDSSYVYSIDETRTPASGSEDATETANAGESGSTEEPDDVAVAAALVDDGTPADSADATESPAVESPVPTEPAATPTDAVQTEPTETPSAPAEEPSATATPPAETPTSVPATEEPATTAPEPTATATPIEISTDATEAPAEPTTPPTDEATEAIEVESPESSPTPGSAPEQAADASSAPPATATPQPVAPTETPAPLVGQPTIAPVSGQTGGDQVTGESPADEGAESPPIVSNDGSNSETSEPGGDDGGQEIEAAGQGSAGGEASGSSPQIVPTDGTNVPDSVGGDNGQTGQGGSVQAPPPIATTDDSAEPSGLDLSDTVTSLPAGTTSPLGRLEFSPGMNLYVVVAPDGQLAVADLDGELVVTLGTGYLPVWSGSGLMFGSPGGSGTQVGIWNSDTGDVSYIAPSDDETSDDVPVGGDGATFYYLRTYHDSGIVELRSAAIDGSDSGVLWTSDAVTLGGARPLYSDSGVYLPTDSEWLFIDWGGNETSLGENPYGYVGAPVLSPGGGLMVYSAGDQVIVAWTTAPGSAIATTPFSAPGGYAFATTGEEIVVSDGSSLHVITYEGDDLGTLSGNQPIGGVYWVSDTIYYLQIGEDAALKSTSLAAIQSE